MIDYDTFFTQLDAVGLGKHAPYFRERIAEGLSTQRHGNLPQWIDALQALPVILDTKVNLSSSVAIETSLPLNEQQLHALESPLRALMPWRKGPFDICGIHIDTEWRSDWKWERLYPHISPLADKHVLDVGCGSGYHCWRMLGEHAKWVLGIDPSPRFVVQFEMIKHFAGKTLPVHVLPLAMEHLPPTLHFFDTAFSMGVLYHRSAPMDHLRELRNALKPGGELILETLVIEGELGEALVPEDRYAMMRNVWFLPSIPSMLSWLKKCGFENARCVDESFTSLEEQRTTDWMPSHSLKDFLDPNDPQRTAEGHPAPRRAVFIANKKA